MREDDRQRDAIDVVAAQQGDRDAFARLIARYQRRVYAVLARRLPHASDAEDVMQNACLLAWQKLDQFRRESSFGTWLTRIALTQAASLTRRRDYADRPLSLSGPEATVRPVPDSQPTAAAAAEQAEEADRRQRLVREAIDRLPSDQRDVVLLKEFDGRSYQEISEIVACPIGTVRSRLHRARQELCQLLRPLLADSLPGASPAGRSATPSVVGGSPAAVSLAPPAT